MRNSMRFRILSILSLLHGCHALIEENAQRATSVKEAFQHAWTGYSKCAGGKDTVDPLSCSGKDDRGGWGVTNIDAIGTALIMNLTEVANEQINKAVNIDFSKIGPGEENEGIVSTFETTIRYIGGLLSVHDLLLNGYGDHIPSSETKAQQLLIQAKSLADTLDPAWKTLSGFPGKALNLSAIPPAIYRGPEVGDDNSAASIGGSQLEYARLSNLTAQSSYVDRSVRAARKLFTPTPETGISLSFSGLVGDSFNINTGEMNGEVGGWIGGVKDYYEYLLKLYLYNPEVYPDFLTQYKLVAKATHDHLVSHPDGFPNATYLASYAGKQATYYSQHLACSSGGSLLQASVYLKDPNIAKLGEDLIAGCRFVAKHTAKGIPPEQWIWLDNVDPVPTVEPTDLQTRYIDKHAYWAQNGREFYYLRPEYLESLFYGYRITKNEQYRTWAWEAFQAINTLCMTPNGFVPIRDVTTGAPRDEKAITDAGLSAMDSFFLAASLKYAYLIFQDDELISLDDWVFNGQGHPIRIQSRDVERKANAECFKYEWCGNHGWY